MEDGELGVTVPMQGNDELGQLGEAFSHVSLKMKELIEKTYKEELIECANKTGLTLTCGGDYHGDTYRASCGTYLPDSIKDSLDIAKFILNTNSVKLRIQEPHGEVFEKEI